MYNDFLQIKTLEGELKISHKKKGYGITVSTKELVYQKPHVNYIIRLEDIITMTPIASLEELSKRRSRKGVPTYELDGLGVLNNHYRIYAARTVMHSRSGLFPLGPTEFILPIAPDLLRSVAQYGQLQIF